jgi:hypothetical protein
MVVQKIWVDRVPIIIQQAIAERYQKSELLSLYLALMEGGHFSVEEAWRALQNVRMN